MDTTMHTIIKIAVVSVLSLFAIVGLVSISKAETIYQYEVKIGISVKKIFKQN